MLDAKIIYNNEEYSLRDFCIWVKKFQIGKAVPHDNSVSVPYRNGKLLFQLSSEPTFDNVEMSIPCLIYGTDMINKHTDAVTKFSGRKVKIIRSDDADYYREGIITIGGLNTANKRYTASITVDTFPFKIKVNPTVINTNCSADGTVVNCINSRMPSIPTFNVDDSTAVITVVYNGKSYNFNGGTSYKDAEIVLHEGDNEITLIGSSDTDVEIVYEEGVLE